MPWTPIPLDGGGPRKGGIFVRRRGRVIGLSAAAHIALARCKYVRVLTDGGQRVRIEPTDDGDQYSRSTAWIGKPRASAAISCSGLAIPDRQRIYCEVVDGGLEFGLPEEMGC